MSVNTTGIQIIVYDHDNKLISAIRNVSIEPVKVFHDLSSCISFIQQKNQLIILVTTIDQDNILQTFESLNSIEAILILSTRNLDINTLPSKVIGVYVQTETLLRALSETLDTTDGQLNARSILFNYKSNKQDNPKFYFYDKWQNNNKSYTKRNFIEQARLHFQNNNQIQHLIDEFESIYEAKHVTNWLDTHRHPFPYYLLISNGIRTHDQEILSMSRFFLNHLNKQMKCVSTEQVYFGTKLPLNIIDRLEKHNKVDVIAFQCYLPVTKSRANAFYEATKPSRRDDLIDVLFKIELKNGVCASLGDILILDRAVPFYIKYVTKTMGTNQNQRILVNVKLIGLNKEERESLLEQFQIRQEKLRNKRETTPIVRDDEARADEHIRRHEWSQAAVILARISNPSVRILNKQGCLLREYLNDLPGALECHQKALVKVYHREKAETLIYLGKVYQCMQRYSEAFDAYSQALDWFNKEEEKDLVTIARCLLRMSAVQRARGRLDDALDYAEQALAIREYEIKPKNDFDVAACLGNIGNILHDQGDIDRALLYAKRAVDLLNKCGKDDPRLAAALNNLGGMYLSDGDLVKARKYFERALEILPNENHPYRESTLANIAQLKMMEQTDR